MKIAVLGASGQLGLSLQDYVNESSTPDQWDFFSSKDLDITSNEALQHLFLATHHYDYVINCAAYTAVDQAESNSTKAYQVNAEAPKELAQLCEAHHTIFIHISTDFVFEGLKSTPWLETDPTNPINIYGQSKCAGENNIAAATDSYFILRTGWLYSKYRHNFLNSMLNLFNKKEQLGIVYDQIGTPTHTNVLCEAIYHLIKTQSKAFGIYHIANEGVASWYDFAFEIALLVNTKCQLKPILTEDYPTPAKRPAYSVLNKAKARNTLGLNFLHWKESLRHCLSAM